MLGRSRILPGYQLCACLLCGGPKQHRRRAKRRARRRERELWRRDEGL